VTLGTGRAQHTSRWNGLVTDTVHGSLMAGVEMAMGRAFHSERGQVGTAGEA